MSEAGSARGKDLKREWCVVEGAVERKAESVAASPPPPLQPSNPSDDVGHLGGRRTSRAK